MAEYIEKKTAIEFFETLQNGTLKDGNTAAAAVWKLAAGIVKHLPKAEVVPVVHGRWEFLGPNMLNRDCMCGTCSVCKVRSKYIVNTGLCPNCGARMDGGDAT